MFCVMNDSKASYFIFDAQNINDTMTDDWNEPFH